MDAVKKMKPSEVLEYFKNGAEEKSKITNVRPTDILAYTKTLPTAIYGEGLEWMSRYNGFSTRAQRSQKSLSSYKYGDDFSTFKANNLASTGTLISDADNYIKLFTDNKAAVDERYGAGTSDAAIANLQEAKAAIEGWNTGLNGFGDDEGAFWYIISNPSGAEELRKQKDKELTAARIKAYEDSSDCRDALQTYTTTAEDFDISDFLKKLKKQYSSDYGVVISAQEIEDNYNTEVAAINEKYAPLETALSQKNTYNRQQEMYEAYQNGRTYDVVKAGVKRNNLMLQQAKEVKTSDLILQDYYRIGLGGYHPFTDIWSTDEEIEWGRKTYTDDRIQKDDERIKEFEEQQEKLDEELFWIREFTFRDMEQADDWETNSKPVTVESVRQEINQSIKNAEEWAKDALKQQIAVGIDGQLKRVKKDVGISEADFIYEVLNGLLSENGIKIKDTDYAKYAELTDTEKSRYFYVANKFGKEDGLEYLKWLTEGKSYYIDAEGNKITYADNLIARHGTRIGQEAGFLDKIRISFNAGIDQFSSGIKTLFTGEVKSDPTVNDYAFASARENSGKLTRFVMDMTQTTTNMLPSILVSTAIGVVSKTAGSIAGATLLGASAAGNAYSEAINNGFSVEEASAYGFLVGLSETCLEYAIGGISGLGGKVTGNYFAKALAAMDSGFMKGAIKLAASGLSEGIEEGLQEILEPLFLTMVTGTKFEFPDWEDIGYAALLGFCSAGIFDITKAVNYGSILSSTQVQEQIKILQSKSKYSAEYSVAEMLAKAIETDPDIEITNGLIKGLIESERETIEKSGYVMTKEQVQEYINACKTQPAGSVQYETAVKIEQLQNAGVQITAAIIGAVTADVMIEKSINAASETDTAISKEEVKSDSKAIVQLLKDNTGTLANDQVVTQLTGNEFAKSNRKLTETVGDFFRSIGNKIFRNGMGDVELDERGIKNDIAHGLGRAKAVTFAAVPDVIAKGRQINYQKNWKGRGYDSYVIAAPIKIGDSRANVAAVVLKDQTNRFYLHEVVDRDGNIIYMKNDTPETIKTGVTAESGITGSSGVPNVNISQPAVSVNNSAAAAAVFGTAADSATQSADSINTSQQSSITAAAENVQRYQNTEKGAVEDGRVLSDGNRGRNVGKSTGEQTGRVAESTTEEKGDIGQYQKTIERRNKSRNLRGQEVSSKELGIKRGTDSKNLIVMPEETWDSEMQRVAKKVQDQTGKKVIYAVGKVQIKTFIGEKTVNGVNNGKMIIVRADHPRLGIEQIANHEIFHDIERNSPGLITRLEQKIREAYGSEKFNKIFERYIENLAGVAFPMENLSDMEYEQALKNIKTEIMADAYAGINAFSANANVYNNTVKTYLQEENLLPNKQVSSASDTKTGPPMEEDYLISDRLDSDLEKVLDGTFDSRSGEVYLGTTSKFLTDVMGAESLEVTTPAEKAYSAMVTEARAKQDGRYNANTNYHGLGIGLYVQALQSAENPVAAFVDTVDPNSGKDRSDRIVLVTDVMADGDYIAVIQQVETPALLDNKNIKSNKVVTVYDRRQLLNDIITADTDHRLLYLDKERSRANFAGLKGANSLTAIRSDDFNNNIANFWYNVNRRKSGKNSKSDTPRVWTGREVKGETEFARKLREAGIDASSFKEETQRTDTPTEEQYSISEGMTEEKIKENTTDALDVLNKEQINKNKPKEQRQPKKPPVESKPTIAKQDLRKNLLSLFSIPDGMKNETGAMIDYYANEILREGKLSPESYKMFFDAMYDSGVMTVAADEYAREGRDILKGRKIYVDEQTKSDFGDMDNWNSFRKRAFAAGIYLTTDAHGVNVLGADEINAELAEMLPGYFNAEATDMQRILERIVEIAEEGKDERMSLADYTALLAQQERIPESELLDSIERQLDWELRTFAQKARLEITLRDRTGIKIAQEKAKHMESMERQRTKRELSELQNKTLKALQWLNKNRYKAPAELKAKIDEVLGDIDIYAVNAANEAKFSKKYNATYREIADIYEAAKENGLNFLPSPELERIVKRLNNSKIADMDLGAIQDLYKAAVGLRTELYNRNNMLGSEYSGVIADIYASVKGEIEQAPGGYRDGVKGAMDVIFDSSQLTPMNRIMQMAGWNPDSKLYAMAKQLEAGERKMKRFYVEAQLMMAQFLTENYDWAARADGQGKDGIWYELEVPQVLELGFGDKPIFGDTVKVYQTPLQKVQMYLESKNYDNLRHMLGGRTFADKALYSQGKRREAFAQGRTICLAPETVKNIVSDLTVEEMALANMLEKYYNDFSKKQINEVSNILYGYDKSIGEYYAPIFTNRNYVNSEVGVFDLTAEGVGNLKTRIHSKNPSYNISAFDAFEKSVSRTATFVGMAIPVRNWNVLMNYREKSTSMADIITHKWGENTKGFIEDLLLELQNGNNKKTGKMESVFNSLLSNSIAATFGSNWSIVAKQAASFPLAATYLGWENVPNIIKALQVDNDLINAYTGELAYRLMGYATPETAQLKNNPSLLQRNKLMNFIFGGGAIIAMDGWTVKTLWSWAANKVAKESPELNIGSNEEISAGQSEFYKAVAKEFEEAVSRSQPMYDIMHRSNIMRNSNMITKTLTLFKTVPQQEYNMLRQAIGEAQWHKNNGSAPDVQRAAVRKVGRAVTSILLGNLMIGTITFLNALVRNKLKRYKDDDDELTAESVMRQFLRQYFSDTAGLVIGGDIVAEVLGSIFTGEKLYDMQVPGVEQANDLVKLIGNTGRNMTKLVTDSIEILNNGGDWAQYMSDNSDVFLKAVDDVVETIGQYFYGLPIENVKGYMLGALQWMSPKVYTAYEDTMKRAEKSGLKGLSGDMLCMRVEDILKDRVGKVSENAIQTLADLYQKGYTDAIPSALNNVISVNGEKRQINIAQQQVYKNIWKSVVYDELDKLIASDEFQSGYEFDQAKLLKRLYEKADEEAKKAVFDDYESSSLSKTQKIVKLLDSDISDEKLKKQASAYLSDTQRKYMALASDYKISTWQYLKFAYEILPQFDESGNGSYSRKEVEKALNSCENLNLVLPSQNRKKLELTTQQCAVLYQIFANNPKGADSPYNKAVARDVEEKIMELKDKAKE